MITDWQDYLRVIGIVLSVKTAMEDISIKHLLMQCPFFEDDSWIVYSDLSSLNQDLKEVFNPYPNKALLWLLGSALRGIDETDMMEYWTTV